MQPTLLVSNIIQRFGFAKKFLNKKKNIFKMKQKIKELTDSQKMTIQLWLGAVLTIFGIILLMISFCVPPLGVIDASVLAAVGEVFTFSGSLIGIDYTYKYKRFKIEDERFKRENREKGYEVSSDDTSDDTSDDEHLS